MFLHSILHSRKRFKSNSS